MWEFWSHAKKTTTAVKKQNENHMEGKKGQDTVNKEKFFYCSLSSIRKQSNFFFLSAIKLFLHI